MIRNIILAASIAVCSVSSAMAVPVVFTKMFVYSGGNFNVINIPCSLETVPAAMNDAGDIVGYYRDNNGATHRFLFTQGTVQPLPANFSPQDINNAGQIVGSSGVDMALYSGGKLNVLHVPNSTQGVGRAINNNGQIVGGFIQNNIFPFHPFLYGDGNFVTVDPPVNEANNVIQDINDAGQILGYSVENSSDAGLTAHGFLVSGGIFNTLSVPGSSYTTTTALNSSGQVIGSYYDGASGLPHAFFYSGGTFAPIDVPGSSYTTPSDIDDAGDIVGSYIAPPVSTSTSSTVYGFLLSNGTVTTLSVPQSQRTDVIAINNNGQILGTARFVIDIPDTSTCQGLSFQPPTLGSSVKPLHPRQLPY